MSASSAASSTLSRTKGAVLVVSALVCAFSVYSLWGAINEDVEASTNSASASGLHRSNAVHRRRRRTHTGELRIDQTTNLPLAEDDPETATEVAQIAAGTLTDGETVVDDGIFQDDYGWRNISQYDRNGQNVVQLLFRVSEDAMRRNAYVHRGRECNMCGSVPIRGIRYHCANCSDFDLCETCESMGIHDKGHIFYKIRVPTPSYGYLPSMPAVYSGVPEMVPKTLPKDITTRLSRETGLERPELDAYWDQWTLMANTEWRDDPDFLGVAMDRKTFDYCLVPSSGSRHPAPNLLFDRMFAFYDQNNDNLISFPEFVHGIAFRKKKEKWPRIFQGYDIDGDGFVERKDFLRLFRSYYVLYRQLHADLLNGTQEERMSTLDAHKLVNGRQPLSSAFQADGPFPHGHTTFAGEGKTRHANGDFEISDGKGVMADSGRDTANRHDLFRRNPTSLEGLRLPDGQGYWEAMLRVSRRAEDLEDTVMRERLHRVRDAVREIPLDGELEWDTEQLNGRNNDEDSSSEDSETPSVSLSDPELDDKWIPDFLDITDEDAAAIDGPGTRLVDLRRSSRRAVVLHALARDNARQDSHERWKKRQFYTDEEEGAAPPSDWDEDEDILARNHVNGESSKAQPHPSMRSRSSSKVRFAEDAENFDTRSNVSSSSRRSVPERWGGIEIPDAEKDAGKEILFQVTQQAFNELLDPLFLDKENEAIFAAGHKDDIERYRSLYDTMDYMTSLDATSNKSTTSPRVNPSANEQTERVSWTMPITKEVDIEVFRGASLEELLATTGYGVEAAEVPGSVRSDPPQIPGSGHTDFPEFPAFIPVSESSVGKSYEEPEDMKVEASDLGWISGHQDPTMPQFKPNSTALPTPHNNNCNHNYHHPSPCLPRATSPTTLNRERELKQPEINLPSSYTRPKQASSVNEAQFSSEAASQPSKNDLYRLQKASKSIQEAKERGGWGRLNQEEFIERVQKYAKDGRGNQMDYLGTWLEFCIP